MLVHIHIKDLAVVSSLELELSANMTTLTGETGAGKSILIDALSLGLGGRADNGMIRPGCDRAEITVTFEISQQPAAQTWLAQQTLDAGDECIMRRILVRDGRSRAYINGSPASTQSVQALGELLVDIHSQHAHQSLLHRSCQRELLDAYASHQPQLNKLAKLFKQWRTDHEKLEQLQSESKTRTSKLDLLKYQINELENLHLGNNELVDLDKKHTQLSNAEKIREISAEALTSLYDMDNSVQEQLAHFTKELEPLATLDTHLANCQELLTNALIQVEEATTSLRQYVDGLELDPSLLVHVEKRLEEIHDLARKYHIHPKNLTKHLDQLQTELNELEHADIHLSSMEKRVTALRADYLHKAKILSKERHKAAHKLEAVITQKLHTLSMPKGVFVVKIYSLPEEQATACGLDQIEFRVSTNPGQAPQALSKVASGGELSRISLAIQVATIQCGQIPTLIFDEVDAGISGGVAEVVGQLLRQLGDSRQVLCITHLPQVAAQGHQHLRISKQTDGESTHTNIQPLITGNERTQEIARMLGGIKITPQTLAHAEEMIANSQS